MIDSLEQELRDLYTARAGSIAPERAARLRAVDYRPRGERRAGRAVGLGRPGFGSRGFVPGLSWRGRSFPLPHAIGYENWKRTFGRRAVGVGVAAMAIVVAIAVIVGIAPGTTQNAFAGWTSMPAPASPAAVSAARAACGNAPASSVVAAETRGPFTALAYTQGSGSNSTPWQCVVKGKERLLHVSAPFPASVVIKPKADHVSLPTISHAVHGPTVKQLNQLDREQEAPFVANSAPSTVPADSPSLDARQNRLALEVFAIQTGPDSLSAASGWVGAGVTGVTFVLRDGTDVTATVGNGWYFAWWPGSSAADATLPKEILVTTASGTHSAPYSESYLKRYFSPCLLNEACVGGYGSTKNPIKSGVSALLIKHFRLFRDVAPASKQALASLGRLGAVEFGLSSTAWGIDGSQTRIVDFGKLGTLLVTPGNEGVCVMEVSDGSNGGSCNDLARVPTQGMGVRAGFVHLRGGESLSELRRAPSYDEVFGLVPDGDVTAVVVQISTGTFTIPIKDNAYLGVFRVPRINAGRIQSVKFKHADGRITSSP